MYLQTLLHPAGTQTHIRNDGRASSLQRRSSDQTCCSLHTLHETIQRATKPYCYTAGGKRGKEPGERWNSSTTKFLEATGNLGVNPQLIHKDNPEHSLGFFYYLSDQQPGKKNVSGPAVPKEIILYFSDLPGCKGRCCSL